MKDIKDRAREYLIKHSEYSEVFDQTFVAVDTLTAMVDFSEQENAELNGKLSNLSRVAEVRLANWQKYEEENKELKELVEKYRQAVDKCLHITFMGGDCEVNTIGQYATLVDGYLTDVEGLAKWKD